MVQPGADVLNADRVSLELLQVIDSSCAMKWRGLAASPGALFYGPVFIPPAGGGLPFTLSPADTAHTPGLWRMCVGSLFALEVCDETDTVVTLGDLLKWAEQVALQRGTGTVSSWRLEDGIVRLWCKRSTNPQAVAA